MTTSFDTLLLTCLRATPHLPIEKLKRRLAKQMGYMPTTSMVRTSYTSLRTSLQVDAIPTLETQLMTKRLRTLSGVAPFAVMMKAHPCPGRCTFCITEKGLPKSYMSDEPAAQRALLVDFDPAQQVQLRLGQLQATGHHADKLQIIVIGGTFSAYEADYKRDFLKGIFDGANESISATTQEAHTRNEHAAHRIVGLSIETRPDWITPAELRLLREAGVTKVQLGVQTLDDAINLKTRRGHTQTAVREATRLLRCAGFKVNYHIMLNLPGAAPDSDIETVRTLFADNDFQPDTLKLYPCIVLPKTALYRQWLQGQYTSWDDDTLIETLIACKQHVPGYCRIDRLTRDITRQWNQSGTQKTNLRQHLEARMQQKSLQCKCIRCREIADNHIISTSHPQLRITHYPANGGHEYFLSMEQEGYLLGMLRLFLPPKENPAAAIFPVLHQAALVRELQVFGKQVPLGEQDSSATQHQQLGKYLLAQAENLVQKNGFKKLAIISGVGVRGYYRKLGYELIDTYMIKTTCK